MKLEHIILPIFVVSFLFYGLSTIETDANIDVSLEVHNFTTNNTPIQLTYDDVNDYGCVMYHFNNVTFPIPTANYDCSNDNVTIYTNGTNVCYPNITANCNYYTTYSYQRDAEVWGIDWAFIVLLVIIGFGIYITYSYARSINR